MPKQAKASRELILDPTARIKKLSDHGSSVQIDVAIPIRRYYRSGSEMERQARVYYSEGQFDRAFILYNKFATLFIEKIPKHPEYSKAAPTDKARIKKLLKQVFPRAMELKDKLKSQFEKEKNELLQNIAEEERVRQEEEAVKREREEAQRRREEAQRQREEELREARERQIREAEQAAIIAAATTTALVDTEKDIAPSESTWDDANQSSITYTEDPLAVENRDSFTEDIVPQEYTRPEPSEEQPPESLHLTATDPTLAHVLPDPAQAHTSSEAYVPVDGAVAPMSAIEGLTLNDRGPPQSVIPSAPPPAYDQVYVDGGHQMMVPPSPVQSPMGGPHMGPVSLAHSPMGVVSPGQSVALNPVLLRQNSYDTMFQAPYQSPPPILPQQQPPPPGHTYSYFHGAPPTSHGYVHQGVVPLMDQYTNPSGQSFQRPDYSQAYSVDVPTVDRSTKPASLKALSTSSSWEGGYRTVVIPGDVATQFEQVASPNTRKNVETCGILAGKLAQNVFRVTHIIVPKQKGQSDSCETTHEEELFDAQDKYDLITLGWIHTHPSQTAFMSSVDLHCHCSYQIMLDEAIAIVCAPKYSQVGMYMLTEPHGLNYITHCEQEGFHVHPKNPPLYEDCKHVQQDNSAFIQIVDLR